MIHRVFNGNSKRFGRDLGAALLLAACLALLNTTLAAQDETAKDDPVAVFNQAQDLHEKGDLTGAIKLYEKALAIEPAFPEAEYQRGMAALSLGKNAEAEKAFRRAMELRADWPPPMTSLGSLLIDKGQKVEADKLLSKAVELEPQNAVALTALTELKITGNSPPAARETLLATITNLTGKANANAALWSARAALENSLKRHAAAKSSAAKALEADPNNRSALFLLADIALSEGDIAKAKDIAARFETQASVSDQLKQIRAAIFADDGKPDEALAQLDSIHKPNKASDDLRKRINTMRTTSAADLEKQLDKNAADPLILGRLCTLYRRENPEKAIVYCRQASAAEPENVNHAVGFGAALVQSKQYETAVGILRKIIEIVPDNFTAHANLATALYQLKRLPEARSEFEWLTNAQPRSPGAYLFLGIIHDEAGEYLDAMANYQLYLRLADPIAGKLDIEKVNLRLPALQKAIKDGKKK